jgi:hypothetical protein
LLMNAIVEFARSFHYRHHYSLKPKYKVILFPQIATTDKDTMKSYKRKPADERPPMTRAKTNSSSLLLVPIQLLDAHPPPWITSGTVSSPPPTALMMAGVIVNCLVLERTPSQQRPVVLGMTEGVVRDK